MQPFSVHSWPKAIAHIDADAFFVECERATNPFLKGKCVVVGKERGIITALSYEAKARGLKRGMRMFEAKKICPEVIIVESDYEKYSLFSVRMFDILKRYSPLVEEYSIDEAFLDLTGMRRVLNAGYAEIAYEIQKDIETQLGISVSIGVAPTKVLAKIASKWDKPHGRVLIKAKEIHKYLGSVDIEDVWGIGPNTASLLRKLNINTALDFALRDVDYLRGFLSKPYIEIWHELRGESVLPIESAKDSYKSISKTATFKPTKKKDFLISELIKNLENACSKARRYRLAAGRLVVFLKDNYFVTSSVEVRLSSHSNVPLLMSTAVKEAFEMIYQQGKIYRQTGIILLDLRTKIRYDLFEGVARIKKVLSLYRAVDRINEKFGRGAIHIAASSLSFKDGFSKKVGMPIVGIDV